jgi:hypothetical protein
MRVRQSLLIQVHRSCPDFLFRQTAPEQAITQPDLSCEKPHAHRMSSQHTSPTPIDSALRARAHRVVPRGMTGHLNAAYLPPGYPQFFEGIAFCAAALQRGVYLHRRHNLFLCLAHGENEIDRALEATEAAFAAVAGRSAM